MLWVLAIQLQLWFPFFLFLYSILNKFELVAKIYELRNFTQKSRLDFSFEKLETLVKALRPHCHLAIEGRNQVAAEQLINLDKLLVWFSPGLMASHHTSLRPHHSICLSPKQLSLLPLVLSHDHLCPLSRNFDEFFSMSVHLFFKPCMS